MAPNLKGQSHDLISPSCLLLKSQRTQADDVAHRTLGSTPSTAKQKVKRTGPGAS